MPRGDKTGPTGAGPMTGRGLGACAPRGKAAKAPVSRPARQAPVKKKR